MKLDYKITQCLMTKLKKKYFFKQNNDQMVRDEIGEKTQQKNNTNKNQKNND